jgi:hypothetical protein
MSSNFIHFWTEESLENVPEHAAAPVTRHLHMSLQQLPKGDGVKIVTHTIKDLPDEIPTYCKTHTHEFDEINIISWTNPDKPLRYRFTINWEKHDVTAPATINIPAGTPHAAEVLSGEGIYTIILFTKNYLAKVVI